MTRDSAADYRSNGPRYEKAWEILAACEVPPSIDVFDWELALERERNPRVSVEGFARHLVDTYQRVSGFFGSDG
jgi:hypothetical protein